MSRVVDNRVVEMEFDNSNFEKNVGKSLSTLDKLKAALSFKGADNDFSMVERAAEGVGKSFSLMEQVATGALRSFGSKLENWAEKTVKTMSGVENIMAGMDKFEKITKSSATLLAQGFSTKEVRRELNKLNWFTDETSYNLTDMVDNISKFTATGQGLQESADAMMGIALWAAKAGQDAPTASRAMYQLSQAMGAYMRQEDWRSIQNANMDMKEFRQLALDTAVEVKTLKKNTDGTYESLVATSKAGAQAFNISQFADKLTEGAWFTPDVMMKVYKKYNKAAQDIYGYMQKHVGATVTDAINALGDSLDEFSLKAFLAGQEARSWGDAVNSVKDALSTKWMGIFQHIFGSSKQATKFFTDLAYAFYDMFVEPMSGVVESFHKWRNAFGRKSWQNSLVSMLESLNNILNSVRLTFDRFLFSDRAEKMIRDAKKIRKAYAIAGIKESKRKGNDVLMPAEGGDGIIEARAAALMDLTNKFKNLSERFAEFAEDTSMFERITKGVLSALGLIKLAISGLWTALNPFKPLVKDLLGWAVDRILALADSISTLYSKAKANNTFVKIFTSILKPFVTLKDKIGEFIDKFVPRFQKRWDSFANNFSFIGDKVDGLKKKFSGFADTIKSKWENLFGNWDIDKTIDGIFQAFSKVKRVIYDLIGVSNDEEFAGWVEDTYKKASGWFRKFRDDIKATFGTVWEELKVYWGEARGWIEKNWDKISNTVSGVFDTIWGFLKGFWTTFSKFFESEENSGKSPLQKIIDSFKKFGEILGNVLQVILNALQPVIDGIRNTIENMNFENVGQFLKGGGIAALGVAFYKWSTGFGKSSWLKAFQNILEGLGEVLGGFTHLLDAKALKEAAIGIAILVASLLVLMSIPAEGLAKAATALATVMLILGKAIKNLTGFKSSASVGKDGLSFSKSGSGGVLIMAALTLIAIAAALRMLASVPENDLYKAMFVIGAIMAATTFMLKAIANIYGGSNNKTSKVGRKNNYKNKIGSGNTLLKVGGPAATIFAFAIFIGAIILAVKAVTDMVGDPAKVKSFWTAIAVVGGIMVALGAFLAIVGSFYKENDKNGLPKKPSNALWKNMISLAATIYIIVLAFQKIVDAINGLDEKRKNDIWIATGVISVIMALITVFAGVTKNGKFSDSGKIIGILLGLTAAIAIVALITAELVKVFDGKSLKALISAGVAIALISGLFIGFVGISKKNIDTTKLLKMAAALVVVGAAIAIAAGSLLAIAQIPENKILYVIGTLLGILVAFAAAGLIGEKVGGGLVKFSEAILMIAGAVALVAIGFLAAAEAIKIFSSSQLDAKKAAENITQFIDQIVSKIPIWTEKILESVLGTLLAAIPATIGALVDAIGQTLADLVEEDPVTGKMKIDTLVENAIKVVLAIVGGIIDNIEEIVAKVGSMLVKLCSSLGDWVSNNADEISTALSKVIDGLMDIVLKLFEPLGKKIFGEAWDGENGIATLLKTTAKFFLGVTVFNWVTGWANGISGIISGIGSTILTVIGYAGKLIGLIASNPVLLGLAGAGGSVLAFGVIDEIAANKRQEGLKDDQGQRLIDYLNTPEGRKEIYNAAAKKYGREQASPDDVANYLRYLKATGYDVVGGKLVRGAPSNYVYDTSSLQNVNGSKNVSIPNSSRRNYVAVDDIIADAKSSGGKNSAGNTYVQVVNSPKALDRRELYLDMESLIAQKGFDLNSLSSEYGISIDDLFGSYAR